MSVRPRLGRRIFTVVALIMCATPVVAARDAADDFRKNWNGRRVAVRTTLHSVVYDEVGRMGIHYRGKVAGLTVATPAKDYYVFDGPGEGGHIAESTPNAVFDEMSSRFHRAYHLDIGSVKTITPVMMRQFQPGVMLVVDGVEFERRHIRIDFRRADEKDKEFATSLTVEWPVPFTKDFEEREAVERVIRRFVEPL